MPTYAYKCENCGHAFEQFQSITAKPIRKCPGCGKTAVKRLVGTGAGIIFKGSGFYQTDYRSDTYKKAAESDKGHWRQKRRRQEGYDCNALVGRQTHGYPTQVSQEVGLMRGPSRRWTQGLS